VLTKTLTDTTTTSVPYSTSGQTRTWTNTWSDALLASIKTPNGNTTKYGYDSSGALTSTTDAKGHVTNITSHTGGGLPLTIVDPNAVTTTLTYSPRLWLTSSTVSGTSGTYKTTSTYDAAGNLTQTTLPDSSYVANTFDTAHRLIKVTDALGNYTSYTLDALGDRTQTSIYVKGGSTASWQRTDSFDALGRLLVDTHRADGHSLRPP
jgi:YD repeat-containing protein